MSRPPLLVVDAAGLQADTHVSARTIACFGVAGIAVHQVARKEDGLADDDWAPLPRPSPRAGAGDARALAQETVEHGPRGLRIEDIERHRVSTLNAQTLAKSTELGDVVHFEGSSDPDQRAAV